MKVRFLLCFLVFCLPNYLTAQTSKYVRAINDTSIHLRINGWTNSIFENPNPPKSYTYNYDFGLPYVENLRSGFMDTFSIAKTQFRYRLSPDTSENCIVEKLENGNWRKIFQTYYSYYTEHYGFLCDVNLDGYEDFVEEYKWYSDAILLNPLTKEFDTSTKFSLDDWTIVDSTKKIFCNYREVHGVQEASSLYTFNGHKCSVLYSIKFIFKEADDPILKGVEIYKGDIENKDCKCALINTIKIRSKHYEFDYASFWRKRYKKLLNYR